MNEGNLNIRELMRKVGERATEAAESLSSAPSERKDAAMTAAASELKRRTADILAENRRDMEAGKERGLSNAMLDRLALDEDRIAGIARTLLEVASMPDPVGRTLAEWSRPSGLRIRRVSTPIGVIGIIYESRPNVTVDAGALCLKSGNASILRGGSDSRRTSAALHSCLAVGLEAAGLPVSAIQLVPSSDRAAVGEMLRMTGNIDVIVPRGGKGWWNACKPKRLFPSLPTLRGYVTSMLTGTRTSKRQAGCPERQDPQDGDMRGGGMPAG